MDTFPTSYNMKNSESGSTASLESGTNVHERNILFEGEDGMSRCRKRKRKRRREHAHEADTLDEWNEEKVASETSYADKEKDGKREKRNGRSRKCEDLHTNDSISNCEKSSDLSFSDGSWFKKKGHSASGDDEMKMSPAHRGGTTTDKRMKRKKKTSKLGKGKQNGADHYSESRKEEEIFTNLSQMESVLKGKQGGMVIEDTCSDGDNGNYNGFDSGVEKDDHFSDGSVLKEGDANVLRDCDLRDFHGSTGKIIKLRIRNFLNHENLEMSFNSNKNIIIGKNGKGKSAIAQAVAVGLGSQGKHAGRDISLSNYIKDYDKNKKNLVCYIEIFLSNSGKNSYKRELYGDVIVVKRILSAHTSKFFLYGVKQNTKDGTSMYVHAPEVETPGKANIATCGTPHEPNPPNLTDWKIHGRNANRSARRKAFIDSYLNFIKLNIRSPCVYLDQEKGKQFFSNITEKALHKFFMNSVGLDIVESEIEKENELLENCVVQIKHKETQLSPQVEEMKRMKERNEMLKGEFERLKVLDNNYKMVVFFNLLKNTIILFNEYLKSENLKNEQVIISIQKKMNRLVDQIELVKMDVKKVVERDTEVYHFVKKNQDKVEKYTDMICQLNELKNEYANRRNEIVSYLSSFEKAKENKNLLQEHLHNYQSEMDKINEKMKEETERETQLRNEISKRENQIYEMEYTISKGHNAVEEISKKMHLLKIHSSKIQKIKNTQIKRKIYTYGYDIYSVRSNILKNYKIVNSSDDFCSSVLYPPELFPHGKNSVLIHNENVKQTHVKEENCDLVFKYEPIGPVGEYIRLRESVVNEKVLSIIEKHLGDLFYSWLVSCYEDKNKLSNMEIENKNKMNIIVTNAFQHINRKTLLQNIHSILNKMNGKTIYSFLNIDLLPTSLLFYLHDNFKVVQTLVCNNSEELHELLRTNDKKIVKSIYVVDEFVVVKVLPNGGLHYQPSKEDYYKKPMFLNMHNEEQSMYKTTEGGTTLDHKHQNGTNIVTSGANGTVDNSNGLTTTASTKHNPGEDGVANSDYKTNEENLSELEKRKEEKNEEIVRTSKKLLSCKNVLESLNESLKKCQYGQDELKYQHRNIEELIQNHDDIFSEQMDLEIKEKNKDIDEIDENVIEIDKYVETLEGKKRNTLDICLTHKRLTSTHANYLSRKKNKISSLIEEYNNLCEVLTKLERDKLRNDEIASKNKRNFLVAINKLHNIYFECLANEFPIADAFLENPFLVLRGRPANVPITNILIDRSVEENQVKDANPEGVEESRGENSTLRKQCEEKTYEHIKNDDDVEEGTVRVTFTVEHPNSGTSKGESIFTCVPLSNLSSFNQLFVLSRKDEGTMDKEESNYNVDVNSCDKKRESEIKVLRDLEQYVKEVLTGGKTSTNRIESNVAPIGGSHGNLFSEEGDSCEEDAANNTTNSAGKESPDDGAKADDIAVDLLDENYADVLWKKRCNKKKEITEMLKINGFNQNDNTDNSIKNYFHSLIEQYENEEKSYKTQMKQINDLKNNYDMHLANIKLRKTKFGQVLKKTKEQITTHFKNMLKGMNNYQGKIEFDDLNRNLKVLVSINQDLSKNIFMEISSLSGGERSTIQMALLASLSLTETSSFHIFDELDVYMDELTRVKNMQRFCEFIEQNNDKQYFFITPHIEITELFLGDAKEKKAKILNLS
ncbi:conserved Plasmodium protein, unknown function [Plasmodium knowlesi strain H]|uniref:RecF/RecN/SMC N-terminal domain-containing protein n=3 Tax=Plasmodium knowlesi TaxID=5850 RepID=A0A5K1TXZ4_PLAKH|nr:structural maintenance of chromosomes protein 6, putative [Plasmodium knowlesi strain H]OTN67195.1 Uncharacterized protein PKNOH_S07445500 [Plasmodium knowlesi]CAA9988582.1 structural maintenance of chromosomes protein 6, putative [Plasmodium knowlesi strain H]SBO21396.1 conserved Plasmodium protein, unknown function [Plasmodium knowlesi strain H]SBO21848.1 conserved Plasmodium protein, unknown function [Plasmodium knowlesi strain H]VVS78056.1 structural maintenance of chromosomes protein 6|eukprot:XP_002259558.1 hypothetical protein, conserved in Plasmodium species [Plasmodium knowlesi strain H]